MRKLFNLLISSAFLGTWILPLSVFGSYNFEDNNYSTECCSCYDCNSCNCCNWEFYFGGIGLGASRKIDQSAVGLNEFFGFEEGKKNADGCFGGTVIGLTYSNPNCLYFNLEFDWATGRLNRKGCFEDFRARRVDELITDIKLGYNFSCGCITLTPYAGFGNWLERYEINTTTNKFHYRSWYGIIGARADWVYSELLSVGIDGEIFLPIYTSVKFKNFSSRIHVHNGWGGKVELPIKLNLGYFNCCLNRFSATISPFFRAIEWDRSNFFTCGIETFRVPKFEVEDYGAKLYVGYCF